MTADRSLTDEDLARAASALGALMLQEQGPSEDAFARLFAGAFAYEFKFCHTRGLWMHCGNGIWAEDKLGRAHEAARDVCRNNNDPIFDDGLRNRTRRPDRFQRASVTRGVLEFAKHDQIFARTSDDWDRDGMLLGTPAGVLHLMTGELLPPDPRLMISKSTSVAPAEGRPERWLSFLDEITCGDQELIDFLQVAFGYMLSGDTSEQVLFFIHGPGGNGKGVFVHTVMKIMGTYAKPTPIETFTASRSEQHSVRFAVLEGARVVAAPETEQGRSWAESLIKQLTGGDMISCRFMYKAPHEYLPQFKILISGNHEPNLRNVDDAMRRRLIMIPFRFQPADPDPHLEKSLEREYPQILQWGIEGFSRWRERGLQRPRVVDEQTAVYFEEQDLFGNWLESCCERDATFFATNAALYESYERHAAQSGQRPLSGNSFKAELRKRGFLPSRSSGRNRDRGYAGLRIVSFGDNSEVDEELIRP